MTAGTAAQRSTAADNGLAPKVAAVAAAREQLGSDLDVLTTEVREQMGFTVEKVTWKIAGTASGIIAAIAVRKLLTAGWRKSRYGGDPPVNPAALDMGWSEAVAWAVATGIGAGIARLVAYRGAAEGWRRATGHLPPGLEDVPA